MSMTPKQAMCEARQLYRLCLIEGRLDEHRVRHAVRAIIQLRRRGYLILLGSFLRLLKLNRDRHTVRIESAEPVPEDVRAHVQADLERIYGADLVTQFLLKPELIGGMCIRVGSDIYDGSVQAGIAELKRRFSILRSNGRSAKVQ
jgi:F-type H+-transporting ATPase subunit delta